MATEGILLLFLRVSSPAQILNVRGASVPLAYCLLGKDVFKILPSGPIFVLPDGVLN